MDRPSEPGHLVHCDRYFEMAGAGEFDSEGRTELLGGLVVSMAPQSPLHAAAVVRCAAALGEALGAGVLLRVQMPLATSRWDVPEPDVAVIDGREEDFVDRHPGTALVVVEVALSTTATDRFTKAALYAAAAVAHYWIVRPDDGSVEARSIPRPADRSWGRLVRAHAGDVLAVPEKDACVAVSDLFPRRR